MQTLLGDRVDNFLNLWVVVNCGIRIFFTMIRFVRILAIPIMSFIMMRFVIVIVSLTINFTINFAMNFIKLFCLGIIRFKVLVFQTPFWRNSFLMFHFFKVFFPHPNQGCSIYFCITTNSIICLGRKCFPCIIIPVFMGTVKFFLKDININSILQFQRHKVTPFQNQNFFASVSKFTC